MPVTTQGSFGGAPSTTAAAGSTQGDAALLSDGFNLVSAADGTKGVILPAGGGRSVKIKNGAGAVLKVYPPSGATVNALLANTAMTMASSAAAEFMAYSAGAYYTNPLLPS